MNFFISVETFVLFIPFLMFMVGVTCVLLRRLALWSLIGQIVSLKAAVAGALLASKIQDSGYPDLIFISLAILGIVPQICLVGLVVIHRCGRFGGSLDVSRQGELRN